MLRKLIWRLGRKLYLIGRREDISGEVNHSEKALIKDLFNLIPSEETAIVFDVGANVGDWTLHSTELLQQMNKDYLVHCFEPVPGTFLELQKRVKHPKITLNNKAISDSTGEIIMFTNPDKFAGTNSLYHTEATQVSQQTVETITLTDYLKESGIDFIHFLKCDTEGHDAKILKAALDEIKQEKIAFWQFEYNHRWVYSRSFLKDVFDMIDSMPYVLAKITRYGLEHYKEWHFELEKFYQSNFLLIHQSYLDKLPNLQSGRIDKSNVYHTE